VSLSAVFFRAWNFEGSLILFFGTVSSFESDEIGIYRIGLESSVISLPLALALKLCLREGFASS